MYSGFLSWEKTFTISCFCGDLRKFQPGSVPETATCPVLADDALIIFSSALIQLWSSIDGCTSFNNHGGQKVQVLQIYPAWQGGQILRKQVTYTTTSLPTEGSDSKTRCQTWCDSSCSLWTPLCSSVTCSSSHACGMLTVLILRPLSHIPMSVSGCGELGYGKSAKVFNFQAICESFLPQKKSAVLYYLRIQFRHEENCMGENRFESHSYSIRSRYVHTYMCEACVHTQPPTADPGGG